MELVSKAEFSRRVKVSKTAISKAISSNKLRVVGEGRSAKIDMDDHLSVNYKNDNSSNRQVGQQAKSQSGQPQNNNTNNSPAASAPAESVALRDEKLRLQTAKLKIEMAEQMGKLILKSHVEDCFSKISASIVSYIFPIGDRLGAEIASIFETMDQDKINETRRVIDKEVGRALEAVKRDIIDSLSEVE